MTISPKLKTLIIPFVAASLIITGSILVFSNKDKDESTETKEVAGITETTETNTLDTTNTGLVKIVEPEDIIEIDIVEETGSETLTPTETATPDYSYLTFDQAFKTAMKELGEGQIFVWNGRKFVTEYGSDLGVTQADWLTYTNPNYPDFSFKYNNSWQIKHVDYSFHTYVLDVVTLEKDNSNMEFHFGRYNLGNDDFQITTLDDGFKLKCFNSGCLSWNNILYYQEASYIREKDLVHFSDPEYQVLYEKCRGDDGVNLDCDDYGNPIRIRGNMYTNTIRDMYSEKEKEEIAKKFLDRAWISIYINGKVEEGQNLQEIIEILENMKY